MADMQQSQSVHSTRIQVLNPKDITRGKYVLYWMQQSQREQDNHALEYAVEVANHLDLPVLIAFGLTDSYPDANLRHYTFMLEGLRETSENLNKRGIKMVVQKGDPAAVALSAGRQAAMIVCDCGYLKHQRRWRRQVARLSDCRVVQVESDVIVPVEMVSGKAEYAARTIRPKIQKQLEDYLAPLTKKKVKHTSTDMRIKTLHLRDINALLKPMDIDRHIKPVSPLFCGGASKANALFKNFLNTKLKHYDKHSNQPQIDDISLMSPYLHFGQISPLTLALKVNSIDKRGVGKINAASFLEQLIVRRELAINFVYYTSGYDHYDCIPAWARQTLSEHTSDKRDYLYSKKELETAQTHDPYWNASMLEMKHTGFMHNYMRMYWGKKILEWSKNPQTAFKTTLELNNRYFLDGRDPNSYTGVAWIYGVHDRAWAQRPIFGKVRYMAASGLERKCDIQAYVEKVNNMIQNSDF